MKFILFFLKKKFNNGFLSNRKSIIKWLNKYDINNYEIIEDKKFKYIVNINGDVDLSRQNLKKIPIKFGIIYGSFHCSNNKLTSFSFAPNVVYGSFYANNNKISSLFGAPKVVKQSFHCCYNELSNCENNFEHIGLTIALSNNKISSLYGLPEKINGSLFINDNKLKDLNHCPKIINGSLMCSSNEIMFFDFLPEKINGFFDARDNLLPDELSYFNNDEEFKIKKHEHNILKNKNKLEEKIGLNLSNLPNIMKKNKI